MVNEGHVFAARIGPSLIQAVGRHEDGGILRQRFKAVVGCGPAVHGLVVGVPLVETKDEAMGFALVVITREPQEPAAGLAVDGHRFAPAGERRRFATASRVGKDRRNNEEQGGDKVEGQSQRTVTRHGGTVMRLRLSLRYKIPCGKKLQGVSNLNEGASGHTRISMWVDS